MEAPSVQMLLEAALAELRTIYAGLQLPKLNALTTIQIVLRTVEDYRTKVIAQVDAALPEEERDTSLPVKITLYRIIQESLWNEYRQANGASQKVLVFYDETCVCRHS